MVFPNISAENGVLRFFCGDSSLWVFPAKKVGRFVFSPANNSVLLFLVGTFSFFLLPSECETNFAHWKKITIKSEKIK